jgi:hypothetical protein
MNGPSEVVALSIPANPTGPAPLTTAHDEIEAAGPKSATPRMLEGYPVPAEDIAFYFDKYVSPLLEQRKPTASAYPFPRYLTLFHPFFPILRFNSPDSCFEADPALFWTVIYVACRRYSRDADLLTLFVDHLDKNVWSTAAKASSSLEAVHVLLLLCAWPLPIHRFLNDPSTTLASIAWDACIVLGLNTGRGSHANFCIGRRANVKATDYEAACTWAACCIVVQR